MTVAAPRAGLPYFAYGSNMLSLRLQERCSSALPMGVAVASGRKLCFDKRSWRDGTGKCRLSASANLDDVVWGVLFRIDDRELAALDQAEGVGSGYAVGFLDVDLREGGTTRAHTYVAERGFVDASLTPLRWYMDLVIAGAEEHRLPETYVEALREVPTKAGPDSEAARRARALLQGRTWRDRPPTS